MAGLLWQIAGWRGQPGLDPATLAEQRSQTDLCVLAFLQKMFSVFSGILVPASLDLNIIGLKHCFGLSRTLYRAWMGAGRWLPDFCRKLSSSLLWFKIQQKQPMPVLKCQHRLKEMAATHSWELIKENSKSEEVIIAETNGFPFPLLGFLPLCAVNIRLMIYIKQLFPMWCYFEWWHSTEWPFYLPAVPGSTALVSTSLMRHAGRCLGCTFSSGKEGELFSACDQLRACSGSWDPCQKCIQMCGWHNSMYYCHFLPVISHHRAWILQIITLLGWLKSRGNLRYMIIAQKSTARWVLWFKQIILFSSVI